MSETEQNCKSEDGSVELTFFVPWGIIAAKAYGDPCLPPVLMVHGIQDNAGSFDRIMPLLPQTFYYVNIDLPGHGKSSRFPKGIYLDFMLYLSAIHRVIRQLKWSRFYYIGHSLGGQLGLYYSALYQDEVEKLVVLDTLSPFLVSADGYSKFYKDQTKKLLEVEDKMLKNDPPNYTYEEALRRMIEHRPSLITRPAAEALIKRSLKKVKNNSYYFSTDQRLKSGVKNALTSEQHFSNISKIQCPVLLVLTNVFVNYVHYDSTKKYFANILEYFQRKANFHIVFVEGYHDVHNSEPEVVAPHVNTFLLHQKSAL